jgi:hypothetical protein
MLLTRQALFWVVFFGTTTPPVSTWGQQAPPAGVPPTASDFANRTFVLVEAGGANQPAQDVQFYFSFSPDGRATFQGKRGTTLFKASPLGWRLVGDSLHLLPGAVRVQAAGTTHQRERAARKYAVEKVVGGYRLQGNGDQLLLREVN